MSLPISLSTSSRLFTEASSNTGAVDTSITYSITNDTFTGNVGATLNASFTNVPTGLTAVLVKASDTTATLSFTGSADAHTEDDSVSDVTVSFGDAAFTTSLASVVESAIINDISIDFNDPAEPIEGTSSNDKLIAEPAGSILNGLGGRDRLYGREGDDTLNGGEDNDKLYGGDGKDRLDGGEGDDKLYGGDGKDRLDAGEGNDKLYGGDGNDRLLGRAGNDYLYGQDGNDKLYSGSGNDKLYGGDGDDILTGGYGNDTLVGGQGSDTYKFTRLNGTDKVLGFVSGEDKLVIDQATFDSLSSGDQIEASEIFFGSTADAGNEYLIYNEDQGHLYYDSDGSGETESPVVIVLLGRGTSLSANDFFGVVIDEPT
jgi:Ca2+-binding RTX toxin-like protein